jgi:hypothetical protein
VVGRFARLIKKYVIFCAKQKTIRAYGRLRYLANKLLSKAATNGEP